MATTDSMGMTVGGKEYAAKDIASMVITRSSSREEAWAKLTYTINDMTGGKSNSGVITAADRQKLIDTGLNDYVYAGVSLGSLNTYEDLMQQLWKTTVVQPVSNTSNQTQAAKKTTKLYSLYDKYYSSSDTVIKIIGQTGLPIWVDKCSGIALTETLGSVPIYTIGDSRARFFMRGNLSVNGFISINMTDVEYFSKILYAVNTTTKSMRVLTPMEVVDMTAQELAEYKAQLKAYASAEAAQKSTLQMADYPLFDIEIDYNNSDPVFKTSTKRRTISQCRIVGFEQGVDISGDGQLVDGYRFIAKEVL